jgi:hypothetical protein
MSKVQCRLLGRPQYLLEPTSCQDSIVLEVDIVVLNYISLDAVVRLTYKVWVVPNYLPGGRTFAPSSPF